MRVSKFSDRGGLTSLDRLGAPRSMQIAVPLEGWHGICVMAAGWASDGEAEVDDSRMGKIASKDGRFAFAARRFSRGHCASAAMYRVTPNSRHQSTDSVRQLSAANGQPALLLEETPKQSSQGPRHCRHHKQAVMPRYWTHGKRGCVYREVVIGRGEYHGCFRKDPVDL
jgi:hypothetical protein